MVTRYGVWLDGLALQDIDPTIYVLDIQEQEPQVEVLTAARAGGDGLRVSKRTRQSLAVVVSFAIREYDTARRMAVLQKVRAWAAAGKYLSTSDRPGQRLRVEVDKPPILGSAMQWTQAIAMTFTAYAYPYWEDDLPAVLRGSGSLFVPGDGPRAYVDVTISNVPGTLTVTVGGTSMTLQGLTEGGTVEITHEEGLVRILEDGASVMAMRTPESSDNLEAVPGTSNAMQASGGTPVFSVRGVWL